MNHTQHLHLTEAERNALTALVFGGQLPANVFRRATALLELARGTSLVELARTLTTTNQTVAAWRDSSRMRGLDGVQDQPRSGRPSVIDGQQRAKITARACSTPPPGHARWRLRLLADKAVALEYCEPRSHTAVKELLKNRATATS